MATLNIGQSLKDTDVLWRYIPLEKFIDLIDTKTLFFTPLAWYEKTDPFEGYQPKVAIDAIANIFVKHKRDTKRQIDQMRMFPSSINRDALTWMMENDISRLDMQKIKAVHKNRISCLTVSCWYKNKHENEGMWSRYSDGGVAIKTSVGAIRQAVEVDTQRHDIFMGTVKYLDFSSAALTADDCVSVDGDLMGMIKRMAYEHENEVRMSIAPLRDAHDLSEYKPEPIKINVDVNKLIEGVVISPLASPLIESGIRAICKWTDIDGAKIKKSTLLENCEHLLSGYDVSY